VIAKGQVKTPNLGETEELGGKERFTQKGGTEKRGRKIMRTT